MKWDAHVCLPLHPRAGFAPVDQLHANGVDYVSINVGMDMNPLTQVLVVLAGFRATIAAHPDRYLLAKDVGDIQRARAEGKIALTFDLEGAMPLQDEPGMVELFASLGVRQILLAYNRSNAVADGCHDAERGLTPLGKRMVDAIHAAGVLMDCSHGGRRCTLQIMERFGKPVIFSHANPRRLVDHARNITDEQIHACAATGGVVCVSGISHFLGTATPTAWDVARHAAYVADLVGIEHVGIGLDLNFNEVGLDDTPPGGLDRGYWWPSSVYPDPTDWACAPISTWHLLPEALRNVGMTEENTERVLGGNMLRVASEVWKNDRYNS
jgi:membrane dipeptidase